MTPQVCLNGRFLDQEITGVQRYGRNLLNSLGTDLHVVRPAKRLTPMQGHLWEQATLPSLCKGSLLWSPGNTGPLSYSHQVVTVHDASTLDHPEWFSAPFRAWYNFLLPRLTKKVRKVITVSEFSKVRLLERCRLPEDKVTVIYNALDSRFQPVDPEIGTQLCRKYGLERPFFLYVGSFEPRKNVKVLLEAWRRLACTEIDLVLVGSTGHVFRGAGFDRLPPNVRTLGRIEDNELPALLSAACCFVFPSVYEGFGFPPLEAMACGCPVVVSNATSMPEVCGPSFAVTDINPQGTALYFDPTNPEELADRMQTVLGLDASTRARLRSNGLVWAQRYNWQTCASQTLALLNQCAAV